jgi:transcriptional regulator with GAF, ATPase, and Fis domain
MPLSDKHHNPFALFYTKSVFSLNQVHDSDAFAINYFAMVLKVLIVEDEFLEASSLKIMLKDAGHNVCGIAMSVNEASGLIRTTRPDIVLVDIYLKGDLTGIELGYSLDKQNIPFIYLSANTNPTTMAEAVLTKPYGFLTKPFREREILVALDVAVYRFQKNRELVLRQEKWLERLLSNVRSSEVAGEEKLLFLIRAFTSFLPFELIVINTDHNSRGKDQVHIFQRVGFDNYERNDDPTAVTNAECNRETFRETKPLSTDFDEPKFWNEAEFAKEPLQSVVNSKLKKSLKLCSKLWLPLHNGSSKKMSITFYCVEKQSYNSEHLKLLAGQQRILADIIESIGKVGSSDKQPGIPTHTIAPNQFSKPKFEGIIGNSPKLLDALDKVTQIAPFDNTALILGETGTGKEGLVRALHALSPRRYKPLIKVNCAAIPAHLAESELFGHEKGSFTGATERRIGKFELANGGILFLDEVGELPVEIQSKLLRALQEKEIERIGGRTTIKIDTRFVAATNRDLLVEISRGKFRMDLYYRINVFPITLPPLRERREDIGLLADYFLRAAGASIGKSSIAVSPAAMKQLYEYSWPGNIRELQNLIERHVLQMRGNTISSFEMPGQIPDTSSNLPNPFEKGSFNDMDREYILAALRKTNGKISGKGGAAELLKLRPTTLTSKMKRLGIHKTF